jgi:hypothetical protein
MIGVKLNGPSEISDGLIVIGEGAVLIANGLVIFAFVKVGKAPVVAVSSHIRLQLDSFDVISYGLVMFTYFISSTFRNYTTVYNSPMVTYCSYTDNTSAISPDLSIGWRSFTGALPPYSIIFPFKGGEEALLGK